ncbi:MAG: translation initiation factor [Dehalococcoidia bacterium]
MPDNSNSRLVYSTDGGRVPGSRERGTGNRPGKATMPPPGLTNRKVGSSPTANSQRATAPPNDGVVRVQRDKKGRGGKTATTITGLPGSEPELDALLKSLKQHCATGGSREDRTLILQGDQREKLLARLTTLGHKPKLAGG